MAFVVRLMLLGMSRTMGVLLLLLRGVATGLQKVLFDIGVCY